MSNEQADKNVSCSKKVTVSFLLSDGKSKDNVQCFEYSVSDSKITFSLDIPENIKAVIIRPTESVFCMISNIEIFSSTRKMRFKDNSIASHSTSNALLFVGESPEITVPTDHSVTTMDISLLITDPEKGDKEAFYQLLSEIMVNNNETIIKQRKELQEQGVKYNKLYADYSTIRGSHNEILTSFYWRATALPRKITHSIKMLIVKNKFLRLLALTVKTLLKQGPAAAFRKVRRHLNLTDTESIVSYKISKKRREEETGTKFDRDIKISVLVPLYNTPEKYLRQMIDSVRNQTYSKWELCLADGSTEDYASVEKICKDYAQSDKRIVYKKLEKNLGISDNTNECLKLATGDYIGLFDHDDLLHPSVLFEVVKSICEKKADFIYTDEVTFIKDNVRKITVYSLKPDYAPDTLRSYNYICHFSVFSKELLEKAGGGFRNRFDGSQDYDLILRLTEKAQNIVHIPKVLYFWRSHAASTASSISAKPYIIESAHKALAEHLDRLGLEGSVEDGVAPSIYKINYEIIGEPLISIVIPNKDHIDDLDKCINAINNVSSYRNFEIIVVENNSTDPETFEYYERIEKQDRIKVVFWNREFNYSAINNFAVGYAEGDYILLLNNDIETITENWLEEMLMFAQRPDVGAVGAKLYYPDDTIQHAGVIMGVGGVAGHSHKYFHRSNPGFMARASITQNLSACTAACLMVPKKVYDEVGGLDEGYAVAFNDVDFCMKIREKGYLIVYTPYAELYHYESKSRGNEDTPEKVARFNSEMYRFQARWEKELEAGDPYYNPNLTLESEDFGLK